MPDIEITAAATADLPVLVAVSERTIRACYTPFLGPESVEGWIGEGQVQSFFEAALPRCRVLRADGAIAGFSATDGALLELLMIDVTRQRRGLGARLLAGSYYGQTVQIWSALITAAVMAAVLVGLVGLANNIVLRWMGMRPS